MDEDVSTWREWKDNFLSYADTLRPGMKEWLNEVEKAPEAPKGSELKDDKATWKEMDRTSLWRAIKACTTGESRKIVDATEEECGYEAWFDLCKNFEPAMQAKKGSALADLHLMSSRRAKNHKEIRGLLNELKKVLLMAGATAQQLEISTFRETLYRYASQDSVRKKVWNVLINSIDGQ